LDIAIAMVILIFIATGWTMLIPSWK